MPNITRIKIKPLPVRPNPTRTKVLLVRQPAKVARPVDHADPMPRRLAIGVIVALGVVLAVWLMGFLGYRLGFAPIVRVRDLLAEPSGGLATGIIMLISIPRVILSAGMSQTVGLMVGFILIAIPGGALAAVKSYPRGGPRIPTIVNVFSITGAVASALNGIALIWWTVSAYRNGMVNELPFQAENDGQWLENLETVSGFDVLAVVAASCWVVLVMRLTIPVWLKVLSASFAFFTLVVVTVAMSMSNATVAQVITPRSIYLADDGSVDARLLLGSTRDHFATLRQTEGAIVVELISLPSTLTVIGTQSIVDYLNDHVPDQR